MILDPEWSKKGAWVTRLTSGDKAWKVSDGEKAEQVRPGRGGKAVAPFKLKCRVGV